MLARSEHGEAAREADANQCASRPLPGRKSGKQQAKKYLKTLNKYGVDGRTAVVVSSISPPAAARELSALVKPHCYLIRHRWRCAERFVLPRCCPQRGPAHKVYFWWRQAGKQLGSSWRARGGAMKLTIKSTSEVTLPPGCKDAVFWDDDVAGFGIRLREGGSRTWITVIVADPGSAV